MVLMEIIIQSIIVCRGSFNVSFAPQKSFVNIFESIEDANEDVGFVSHLGLIVHDHFLEKIQIITGLNLLHIQCLMQGNHHARFGEKTTCLVQFINEVVLRSLIHSIIREVDD